MANRFLETNYYKSPFVRGLKGALKGLYSFIICDCTPSGIWPMDMEASSMYIGFPVTVEEFKEYFVNKGKAIDVGSGRYFFPDFIEHQYPSGLQSWNKSHNKIIIELMKFDFLRQEIVDREVKGKIEKGTLYFVNNKGASKGLQSPHIRTQGNGNGLGNGNKEEDKLQKKTFNTKPFASDFNGLPENYVTNSIELVRITAQSDIDENIVTDMWNIFKNQKLTGSEYYANEGKVYSHFIDWIKKQKFTNGTNQQPIGVTKFNAGALELLGKAKQQYANITGQKGNKS